MKKWIKFEYGYFYEKGNGIIAKNCPYKETTLISRMHNKLLKKIK